MFSAAAALTGVTHAAVAWGDYDNDGRLDILLTGDTGSGYAALVYHNNGDGTFSDARAGLAGVAYGDAAWGDYDNDGDLDILLAGNDGQGGVVTRLYRNDDCPALSIAKQVEPATSVDYHGTVTYTVTLSNTGAPADRVLLTDTLPSKVDFGAWVGDSHGAVVHGSTITWTGTVSTGKTITWTWQVTHTGDFGDVVTNTVTATYPAGSQTVEDAATFSVKAGRPLPSRRRWSPRRTWAITAS